MAMFKTLSHIKNNPWEWPEDLVTSNIAPTIAEKRTNTDPIGINDVKLWEEIYYEPGNIGVYAAYQPYDDIFIIVYNLFSTLPEGIEVFSGENAQARLIGRCSELGISLIS